MTTRITHWTNGAPTPGGSGRSGPVFNPATGQQTGEVDFASAAELDAVVASATEAAAVWRSASLATRTGVLFRFRELLAAGIDELAAIITAEHGKVLSDAKGEIQRGLENVEYACGVAEHMKGGYSEQAGTGVDTYSIRQPLGVVAGITPFNFPAMVPLWMCANAIATGNSFLLKPSEKDPSASLFIADLWKKAGLPDGVFSVVQGDKEAVDAILAHRGIAAVSFVGSTPIARYIYETGTRNGKRVQALGGAKNHMLVLADADLDGAADAAINAGFGSAGERCMAVSVAVVAEPIADAFVAAVAERMSGLRVGDGRRGCDMGPLITREHRDRVSGYLDIAVADGARIVVDGRGVEPDGAADGFWLGPTLIDGLPTTSAAYRDEIFGPVLAVIRVPGYAEGIELINANPYGNGAAVFTRDGGAARRFEREVTAGMVGVNVPIPVPVAYYSFGGWKASAFGDTKAYGPQGFHFFTREKAITRRWPEQAAGIDLGFPVAG
jgi:malonate-semialdehyde dehydrogenase (acetylating)/methylmalonate-semialdehyde dehydrogenase